MFSTPANFTIAEYCQQFDAQQIIINKDYQRSSKVWPQSARSYLIDTILFGYPIPKILLRQKTDLRTRTTIKEVVDGQQRTGAIVDFFNDKLAISRGDFKGKRFSTLAEEQQRAFLGYPLSADLFPEATDEDIREVFRRINSYTVPLNPQELRYATYQGDFKWFVHRLAHRYAQTMKDIGVFSEAQLSRMADSEFLTEVFRVFQFGIESNSNKRLDDIYKKFETEFPNEAEMEFVVDSSFGTVLEMQPIWNSSLSTRYNFYSLFTAIGHARHPFTHLPPFPPNAAPLSSIETAVYNLSRLADAIDRKDTTHEMAEFVKASSAATNRLEQRVTRFKWMCRALLPEPL